MESKEDEILELMEKLQINDNSDPENEKTIKKEQITPKKNEKPSKKPTPKKTISEEDLIKIENIKIHKQNHNDLFIELKDFFLQQKKNFNENQTTNLKKIFEKNKNFKFTNLFIHSYFKYIYNDFEISNQDLCDAFNFRTAFVQQMMEKPTEEVEDQVVDHQAFSAFLKVIFSFLKDHKSCKLYNIFFAIFIFNSTLNLKVISKKQNSNDSKHEGSVNKSFKSLKKKESNGEKLYETYKKDEKITEFSPYLQSKLIPSLNFLLPYCKCSSSICGMFEWVFRCWGEESNKNTTQWIVSSKTIKTKKDEFQLQKYLFSRNYNELFIIGNDEEEMISFTNEELEIDMNDLNLRVFITLAKTNTMKNINEILDQFEQIVLDNKNV